MNPEELYEKQYGEKKLKDNPSLLFLRKIFKKSDLHREDLVLSMLKGGGKFLDVGCGSGSLAFKVRKMFNEVYGVDVSPSRIKEAQKAITDPNNVHFDIGNIEQGLNFSDKSFDTVTCMAVLEHIFDPYSVVSEINRVLKKDGILVIEVPNIAYIKHRIRLFFGKLPITGFPCNWKEIGWDGGHLHYFTKSTVCTLLKDSGFRILKVSGCGLFASLRNFWPSLLTGDLVIKAQKI